MIKHHRRLEIHKKFDEKVQQDERENNKEPTVIINTSKESVPKDVTPKKGKENIIAIQTESSNEEDIMSETGTNFDESIFYDQATIDMKEEEKFYYKFEDWESPSASSPLATESSDYIAQKYFDNLEGNEVAQEEFIKEENQNEQNTVDSEHKSHSRAPESTNKQETTQNEHKKDKTIKCNCEKERKQFKNKKDKHYDEEQWENVNFKGKQNENLQGVDGQPCNCKWKLLSNPWNSEHKKF